MKELVMAAVGAFVVGGIVLLFANRPSALPKRRPRHLGYLSDGWNPRVLIADELRRQRLDQVDRG